MAVRQRIFNSTSPFSGTLKAELKGSYPSCPAAEQEPEEEEEEAKDCKLSFTACFSPLINKVLTHGTAEQVGELPLKTSAFIAQAECETQDSQEFSPSCSERSFVPSPNCFTSRLPSEHNNVACPTTASVQQPSGSSAPLGPRRRSKKRHKGRKRVEKKKKNEKQRHRHRTSSGVPEQESGGSLVRILEDSSVGGRGDLSSSCCSSVESSEEQHRGPSPFSQQISNTGSSCSPLNWRPDQVCGPLLRSYVQDSDSDSVSSGGNYSLALAGLRGSVSQGDPCYAGPFFKDVERDVREDEDDFSAADSVVNEGIIFYNEKIQPVDSEYKEQSEYVCSQFITEGSYGEVHCAQDVNTGYKFAVKKVSLKRFNSEEVGAWSILRSPRVVELFGVVREGPNVVFLMDHKAGSLGQLIVERGRLPEDLSLHYHGQVLTALEYLRKKKVAHLDVKADNVLLSEDGRDSFLCDFGHAERLDSKGQSTSGSRDLKGSETHMAPEIVKGEPRGAKADVWSSCCMLLHMLNGCQPWTRFYTCRLYLKIANDPPPLREIPPHCSRSTAEVMWAGLQKDAAKRATASELREKTDRALREAGGLTSPVRGPYTEPLFIANKRDDSPQLFRDADACEDEEDEEEREWNVSPSERNTKELRDDDVESEADSSVAPRTLSSEPKRVDKVDKVSTVPELELRKLERDFYLNSLSQLHSAEKQEQLLSCLSSDPYSNWEPWDKKDSGRWSLSPADDFSSGVFSLSSQPDVPVFSLDLLSHSQPPPPCCFEGVDVCILDSNQRSIRIREKRCVKVGHIATGISDQICERVFTLETAQGQQVAHDEEVQESGLELCCVPAPDFSPVWRWRIRDGVLETR